MSNRFFSYLLVVVQMLSLLLVILSGPVIARQPFFLFLQILAIGLGVWAIVTMGRRTITALPMPKTSGELVQAGPYRWIRHPMYTSLILFAMAALADSFSPLRLVATIVLTLNQVVKLLYEESLLRVRYPDYAAYQKRSKRLIPFLF